MIVLAMLAVAGLLPCLAEMRDPLQELMPVPFEVTAREGTVESSCIGRALVKTAPVKTVLGRDSDEAYALDIVPTGIVITASGRRGVIWAKTTLHQLARLGEGRLPCCHIVDGPRFPWRGFMADCGRNYIEIPQLKAMIDAMSANKLNLFHWHLTEYYGWRLESKRHPELQRAVSFYLRHIGKFYTQNEFREIVDYAWERGVTVMPELDVPGHALAFRRAFGFRTMRDEGVRERLCNLVDELCSLVQAEKMPFIHLGTDEARLPEEKVPLQWLEPMVRRVQETGRTVVGWMPGELRGLEACGRIAGMRWGNRGELPTTALPCFDAAGMYLDTLDPFEVPGVAANRRICPWLETEGSRLGGVVCAWHDDFARDGRDFMRNQTVLPAFTMFGDAFWRGRENVPTGNGRQLLVAGRTEWMRMRELERRVIAQRDKVWHDSTYPYHFLRQTDLRWRVTDAMTGKVVARNVAQATVFLWRYCNSGEENGVRNLSSGGVFTNKSGVAVLETWIRSPKTQKVGAWIGFTAYSRNHGRAMAAPTPEIGSWVRTGATVMLNGAYVLPPVWKRPGRKAGRNVPNLLYVHELDEAPFEDEEYYMRPPTQIILKEGWNHVRLTVPCIRAGLYAPWVATFTPMCGTTEHPKEVPGLVYSCDPPAQDSVMCVEVP